MGDIPNTRSATKSSHLPRYVEVTAIVLRDTRESTKHGLAKASWKLKEQAKNILKKSDRVIIEHANGAEETFEKERNQSEGDVVIGCAWCVGSLPRSICRLLKPTQFYSTRA